MLLRPEDVWPVDSEYQEAYYRATTDGVRIAAEAHANIVAIARNAMPRLENTLALLSEVQKTFRECRMFVFENDSTDGTAECLDRFASENGWFEVRHDTWGGVDCRGFERERTERLAKARNICLDGVRASPPSEYTIVVDLDPAYGFSVGGVFNSIAHLEQSWLESAGAMASYSLYRVTNDDGSIGVAHYDAWAARLNWWRDRRDETGGMAWFSMLLPPVGSPPIRLNSAFGGLCVYKTPAFLAGGYSGEDCEHVPHHRRMTDAGWSLYLNPGCRYVAIYQ